jgi:hypothetical protein
LRACGVGAFGVAGAEGVVAGGEGVVAATCGVVVEIGVKVWGVCELDGGGPVSQLFVPHRPCGAPSEPPPPPVMDELSPREVPLVPVWALVVAWALA